MTKAKYIKKLRRYKAMRKHLRIQQAIHKYNESPKRMDDKAREKYRAYHEEKYGNRQQPTIHKKDKVTK